MNDLNTLVTEDRRLRILSLLEMSAGYVASVDVLHMVLTRIGHAVSHDRLGTDIEWLHEQGLVDTERLGGAPMARLTGRGLDVARGLAVVPGVARPRPE